MKILVALFLLSVTAYSQVPIWIAFTGNWGKRPIDSLVVGNDTNAVTLDSARSLRMRGKSTVFNDLSVPLSQTKIGANLKPDYDYDSLAYMFPQNDTSEIVYLNVQLPHWYKEGSTVYPHVHVQQSKNAQATFKMVYKWFNVGAAVPSTWTEHTMGTYAVTYTSGRMQNILQGSSGISGSGKTLSSMLLIKLYRSDNVYSGDIGAVAFDLHVEMDALGSDSEYGKAP